MAGTIRNPSRRADLWDAHRTMLAEREAAAKPVRDAQLLKRAKVLQVRQLARLLRADSQGDLPSLGGTTHVNEAWRRSPADDAAGIGDKGQFVGKLGQIGVHMAHARQERQRENATARRLKKLRRPRY